MRLFAQWWTQNREHSTELTIHKNTWCLNVGKDADERDVHYFCWRLIAVLLLHWHPFRFVCLLSLHKLCVHKLPVDSLPTSSSRDRDWFTSTLLRNKCETHLARLRSCVSLKFAFVVDLIRRYFRTYYLARIIDHCASELTSLYARDIFSIDWLCGSTQFLTPSVGWPAGISPDHGPKPKDNW